MAGLIFNLVIFFWRLGLLVSESVLLILTVYVWGRILYNKEL
ncbi:protein of unknown function [Latilactobacillus sakei]|nr:protein of unknown function [Latilactobacillus sakei]